MTSLRETLEALIKGKVSLREAEKRLRLLAVKEVENIAKIDVGRRLRGGIPEVVLAEGKGVKDLVNIVNEYLKEEEFVLVSRLSDRQIEALKRAFKGYLVKVNKRGRVAVVRKGRRKKTGGKIGILAAGTSDLPVAEEARFVAEEVGCQVLTAYDVGVAGVHRLFPRLKEMLDVNVDVLVVVAGMEGALPSIVAGMVDVPVIGVPTSRGYGMGGGGVGALTTMLQSCSLGVLVVNIDNGVAAGASAALIANRFASFKRNHRKPFKPSK
jgi:hypothetical protein